MEAALLEYLTGQKIHAPNGEHDRVAQRIFMAATAGHEAARHVARGLGKRIVPWADLPEAEKRRILVQTMMIERHEGTRHTSVRSISHDAAARICVICACLGYPVPRL